MKSRSIHVLVLAALTLSAATAAAAPEDATALVERGLFRRAAEVAQQRLAVNPADAPAKAALARVLAIDGKLDEAVPLAAAAAAAAPKDAAVQYAYAEVCAEKAQSVSMLKAAGWAGKLKKAAEAALAADPRYTDAMEMLIEFHLRAPGVMGGDKKQAAALLQRLEQADPAAAALRKASEAFRSKDTTLAAGWLAKAAEAKPASPQAMIRYASYLTPSFRDPARAEKLALQAVELEPWRTSGWQVLASLYTFQQRDDELEKLLARAEAAEPSHLSPRYQAARQLLSMKRDPARAERYLRAYLAKPTEFGSPSHGGARWRLGQALELQGKKSEAIAEIEQALKLDPKLDDAKKDLKRLRG